MKTTFCGFSSTYSIARFPNPGTLFSRTRLTLFVHNHSFNAYDLSCDLSTVVSLLEGHVLPSVTRIEMDDNPHLTTGAADVGRFPTAPVTPSATLAALLAALPNNATHLHLESGGSLFAGTGENVSPNTFTNEVCAAFRARLSTLASVRLRNTGARGSFPENADCLLGARSVDVALSDNSLTGSLPTFTAPFLSNLLFFKANANGFTGPIPPAFASRLTKAVTLDFSDNSLNGTLARFGDAVLQSSLLFFKANNNSLTGTVPASLLGQNSNVSGIDLSDNLLSGTLPRDAFGGKRLTQLVLGNNALTGGIPDVMTIGETTNQIAKTGAGLSQSPRSASLIAHTMLTFLFYNQPTAFQSRRARHPESCTAWIYPATRLPGTGFLTRWCARLT